MENEIGEDSYLEEFRDFVEVVKQLEGSLRIIEQPLLEKSLSHIFTSHKQLRAYELTNGIRGSREIAKLVGAGQKTISRWWMNWEEELKIVEKIGTRGQYTKKYSLIDLMTMKNNKKWIFLQGEEEQKEE